MEFIVEFIVFFDLNTDAIVLLWNLTTAFVCLTVLIFESDYNMGIVLLITSSSSDSCNALPCWWFCLICSVASRAR